MASAIDPAVVEYEYDRKKPYFKCNACGIADTTRGMEDHIVRRHLQGPAPFECGLCSKKFARKDAARGHVTKTHPKQVYKETVAENPEAGRSLLTDYSSILTRNEGLCIVHNKLAARDERSRREKKEVSKVMDHTPEKAIDLTASPQPKTFTPLLEVHPPIDELLLTPLSESPVETPATVVSPTPTSRPAPINPGPSTQDIMDVLLKITSQQGKIMDRLDSLEKSQASVSRQVCNVAEEVARAGRQSSTAQGENRRIKEAVKEIQREVSSLVDQREEMQRATTAVQQSAEKIDSIRDEMRSVSTGQTSHTNRTRSAIRELVHGVQRSMEAFENRPRAHLAPRNDAGRTEREDRTRRPLEM